MNDELPAEPFLFKFSVERTPSPNDPVEADEFYRALGLMLVAWGRLEGHFVAAVLLALALAEGDLGYKLPMDWKARSKIWRKAFDVVPDLFMFKASAVLFLEKMEMLALDRHAIVHSLWEGFNDAQPLSIGAVLIRAKNKSVDGLDIRRAQITIGDILDVVRKANELNLKLTPLSQFLSRCRNAQKPPPSDIRVI